MDDGLQLTIQNSNYNSYYDLSFILSQGTFSNYYKLIIFSSFKQQPQMHYIYLPPSYSDNTLKQYQVLLMHDGQNLFDPSQAAFGVAWLIQNTINNLIVQGKMKQIIVVGIWNTNQRNNQYTYSYDPKQKFGGKGDQYIDFIQDIIIPTIENQWFQGRTNTKNGYYIGGSSLGGLISCYAAYTRPKIFTKAICMSSSFWWNNQDFNKKILSQFQNIDIYLDSGDSGPSQDGKNETITVLNHLNTIDYKESLNLFYFLDKGGQHNEKSWGNRFYVPMINLFGP